MNFKVMLTASAVHDLESIYGYLLSADSKKAAEGAVSKIEKAIDKLETLPEKGRCPPELASLGILGYREVLSTPYRLVYQVIGEAVYVMLIADGRRDMRTLLEHRLLRP